MIVRVVANNLLQWAVIFLYQYLLSFFVLLYFVAFYILLCSDAFTALFCGLSNNLAFRNLMMLSVKPLLILFNSREVTVCVRNSGSSRGMVIRN